MFGRNKKDPVLQLEEDKVALQREATNRQTTDAEEAVQFHKQERQDLLRWQQDLLDDLEQLKRDLRRQVYDADKDEWVSQQVFAGFDEKKKAVYETLPPLMNEDGIRMVESLVRPFLSRNLINSNLDEDMVYGILRRTSDALVSNLVYYGESYDLEFGNYDMVVRLVKNVIIPTPFRAAEGWTKKIDSTISKRLESFTGDRKQEDQSSGMFSGLLKR